MHYKKAWIFSHGSLDRVPLVPPGTLVIAADGGARHLLGAGLCPDIAVGDFDSLGADELAVLERAGSRIVRHRPDKDKTDTHIAVELALESDARDITIFGGLGGRFDHSLANVMLLRWIHEHGGTGCVTDGEQIAVLLTDRVEVSGAPGDIVSVLPLSPVLEGLTITGLRYPLNNVIVRMGDTWTVSNEIGPSGTGEITLRDGMGIVVTSPQGGHPGIR